MGYSQNGALSFILPEGPLAAVQAGTVGNGSRKNLEMKAGKYGLTFYICSHIIILQLYKDISEQSLSVLYDLCVRTFFWQFLPDTHYHIEYRQEQPEKA